MNKTDYSCLKNISILVVENDKNELDELCEVFGIYFKTYYRAKDGREGFNIYKQYKPDIIFTDVRMPVMDGIDMATQIRELDYDVPIIMNSAYSDTDVFLKAFQNKISGFITKPIEIRTLLDMLLKKSKLILIKKELAQQQSLVQNVVNEIPNPVMVIDTNYNIILMNEEMKIKNTVTPFVKCYKTLSKEQSPCHGKKEQCKKESIFLDGLSKIISHEHKDKTGKTIYTEIKIKPLKNEKGEIYAFIKIFHDITVHKNKQNELLHVASHDSLTGLPNRSLLLDRMQSAIKRSDRNQRDFAIIFIDIDDFKKINDLYSHYRGDLLLKLFAQRIGTVIREVDTLARLGGDEFIILLESIQDEECCKKILSSILETMNISFDLDGIDVKINCSIGTDIYKHKSGKTKEELLHNADIAMYNAKKTGKNIFSFSCV